METWNQLSDEELKIGFVASCIESAAEKLGCGYDEMLNRMERVGLIDKYIYPHYEALHSEGRNNLTDNIIETLNRWETNQRTDFRGRGTQTASLSEAEQSDLHS